MLKTLSLKYNKFRGGDPRYTICAQLWEDRLHGVPYAALKVSLINLFFREQNHCNRSWLRAELKRYKEAE